MVGDRCKPINVGESDTVRITMSIHEARILFMQLVGYEGDSPAGMLHDIVGRALRAEQCRGPVEGLDGSVEFFDGSEACCVECGRRYSVSFAGDEGTPHLNSSDEFDAGYDQAVQEVLDEVLKNDPALGNRLMRQFPIWAVRSEASF